MADTHRNMPGAHDRGLASRVSLRSTWPPLTEALKLKASPLKAFLTERFPNTKPVFQQYKESVGPIRVLAPTAPTVASGTVGGAFDHMVRFLVDPQPDMYLPAIGAWRCGGRVPTALAELAETLGTHSPSPHELEATEPGSTFAGPLQPATVHADLLARGCWALSLLTELGRGVPVERSPLTALPRATVSGDDLLSVASTAALDQLAALRAQADAVLIPALATRTGPWALGPTFDGSAFMNADADLVAAGTLVEIKTELGSKRKDGSRYATLDNQTLFQMLSYVLLDFHDEFGIHELALFSARYGHLSTWNLLDLLRTLAGQPVNLIELRAEFAAFLRPGQAARMRT